MYVTPLARRLLPAIFGAAFLLVALATAVHGSAPAAYDTVTVRPGDTLWSIASQRYPDADPRQMVDEIAQDNHMSRPIVYPGERLKVPAA
jgi:LysM repeat protein